ncbi:MAG: hypothetical protein Q8P67_05020, partial [archaeon]|nr:hypothetical protein [archaeon]
MKRYVHDLFNSSSSSAYAGGNEFFVMTYPNGSGMNNHVHLNIFEWSIPPTSPFPAHLFRQTLHGIVVVVDSTTADPMDVAVSLRSYVHSATNGLPPSPLVLVFTKADLKPSGLLAPASVLDAFCNQHNFVDWFSSSAIGGINIPQPFLCLIRQINHPSIRTRFDTSTSPPPRFTLHQKMVSTFPKYLLRTDMLHLTEVDLSGCSILFLPPAIGQLICLESLNLQGNQLQILPDTLHELVALKDLNLSD